MIEKTVITVAMVVAVMVLIVGSVPLTEMKHITLHVQKEVLEGHKIVITLEPFANDTQNLPVEFQDEFTITLPNLEEVQGQQTSDGKSINTDSKLSASDNEESEMPDSTTPLTEETTTDIPTNSSSSNITVSTDTQTAIIPPSSSDKKEPGVSGVLVTVPPLKCPEGQLPDPNGKCRDSFHVRSGNIGKSMRSSNFIPSNRMKNLRNKFGDKFMG